MIFAQVRFLRKLTYSAENRRFTQNPNLHKKHGFGPKLEFCNSSQDFFAALSDPYFRLA